MKIISKRTISYLLILCLLIQTCFAGFAFADTASVLQQIEIDGTVIDVNQGLRENADGTYTLSVELSSEVSKVDKSENNEVSKNDYFTAKQPGDYLIQLWGGDGADGSDTSYSEGGKGGKGGYIYGIVTLEAGQTLFYEIGGNGTQTLITDDGGGANGDGGGHGDMGSYAVGGGGGYSAVYLFDKGEFEANYLDENGQMTTEKITEEDRTSKYIMIAAGGGGGGAGDGFTFGQEAVGTADGGNGGSVGSNSGELIGSEYDVEGIFYAGDNGKSSGTSFEYIGHGGTNNPGAIADTFTTLLKGKQPNDWKGLQNSNYAGGSGGSGNFRGGAGGAGFCGGSGGIMTSILIANNVGGGGGGSSFIASTVETAPSDFVPDYTKNDSEHGGMVSIEYKGNTDDLVLKDLSLSATISTYFDITGVTGADYTCSGQSLSISNIDLGDSGEPTTVEITFKPKDGFAGGNDVPLFEDDELICSHGGHSATFKPKNETSYVNVPLDFDLITDSYSYNEAQSEFDVANLYKSYGTTHNELRQNFKSDYRYDFIDSISEIIVQDSTSATLSGKIDIQETTQFDVSYIVKLKTEGEAVVGEKNPVETIISKKAVVSIFEANETTLNGVNINYSKLLSYVESKYQLSLNVKGEASNSTTKEAVPEAKTFEYGKTTETSYTVTKDGYYLIQAWGGNGGRGYDNNASGGTGGTGGYINAYAHFNAGDIIYFTIGANGADATNNEAGGQGGTYSSVSLKEKNSTEANYILIAGGAGGGGNGSTGTFIPTDGEAGVSVSEKSNVLDSTMKSYSGSAGGIGKKGSLDIGIYGGGGAGGSAGANYINDDKLSQDTSTNSFDLGDSTDYTNNGGGAVYIKCLQLDYTGKSEDIVKSELEEKLSNYIFNTEISRYFDIEEVSVEGIDTSNAYVINDYTSDNIINITNINPIFVTSSVTNADGTKTFTYSFDYTVNIKLTPKEEFLGGNDVPVVVYDGSKYTTGMQLSQGIALSEVRDISKENKTDFANVEIPITIQSGNLITHDQTYVIGTDDGIPKSSLYTLSSSIENVLNSSYTGDDAWKVAFVNLVIPASDLSEKLTPQEKTTYTISAGIEPEKAAEKAIVVESVEDKVITKTATIYVNYNATYNLTNMTTSDTPYVNNIYAVDPNSDYSVTLTPTSGYLLPETISVSIGGVVVDSSKYTYDNQTGALTIPKDLITGNIVIEAKGEIVTYSLNFVYEIMPGFGQYTKTEKYPAGTPINAATTFAGTYVPTAYDGYTFVWNWATEDGNPITQMPAQNWWVTGQYVANDYNLTINYYKGSELHSTHTETIKYGNAYNITSPTISGYIPDNAVVQGTMPAEDLVIDVTYTATANQLNIIYIKTDTNTEVDRYTASYDTDEAYNVSTPSIEGYTADKSSVSGTMTADGVVVYVYYSPNEYKVTFNADGGNLTETERTVIYNNTYGYDSTKGQYSPLPEPIKVGYTFDGWYLGGEKVTEETKVSVLTDPTLVARWKTDQYSVTVKYVFEDGTKALDDYKKAYDYNTTYDIKSPDIEGYTPSIERVEGTIGAQNVLVTVKYIANEYTLTVNYINAQNGNDIAETVTKTVAYKDSYSVTSPIISGYTASTTVVEGVMPAEHKTVTVYYYKDAPTISVDVTWGDLSFNYQRGDWNTETLTYGADSITPVTAGQNTVTVKNNETSTIPVIADITYKGDSNYSRLNGYFTDTNSKDGIKITERTVDKKAEVTSYLWLEGSLDRSITGTIVSGTCEVTIRGGN